MPFDTTSADMIMSMFYYIIKKDFEFEKKQKCSTLLLCQVAIALSENGILSAAEIRNWITNFCKLTKQGTNPFNILSELYSCLLITHSSR